MNFGFGFLKRSTRTTLAITLTLSQQQDGFGFYYGAALSRAGTSWNVNIMPPQQHWRGDFVLERYEPHQTDWVIYIGDEEIAHVTARADITRALQQSLIR